MKNLFEKENLVKIGVALLAIVIIVVLAILFTSRDGENGNGQGVASRDDVLTSEEISFYSQYENMDLAELGSYRFDIRVNEPDYSTTVMQTNYRNQQLYVHSLSTFVPEDEEGATGRLVYSMDEEVLYRENEDGTFSRFTFDYPFTSSEIFLESIDNMTEVELFEGDEEELFGRREYRVTFTKEYFNAMMDYTNSDVVAEEDVEGFVTVDGDYIFRLGFDHEDVVVEISFYALGSGSFTELN